MAVVTSLVRGIGKTAGWTAASLVAAGSSALDQLGESGEVLAESYEEAYEQRASYLDMTPAERKAHRVQARADKRAAIAARREPTPAVAGKKSVKA